MFLSREIDIKLCYTKIGIYQVSYKICRFKQIIFSKYATNLKTTISQTSLSNLGLIFSIFFLERPALNLRLVFFSDFFEDRLNNLFWKIKIKDYLPCRLVRDKDGLRRRLEEEEREFNIRKKEFVANLVNLEKQVTLLDY